MTQNNLGNVLSDLGERSSGEESGKYLEQAVAAYRAALEVRYPRAVAAAVGNDAEQSGHRAQGPWGTQQRGREREISGASRSRLPRRLGSLYPRAVAAAVGNDAEQSGHRAQDLGERSSGEESGKYLEQAVAAYRAALEVYTREQLPQDWAMTQYNLGIVLRDLGERSSGTERICHFQESVVAFENALTVLTPKYYPAQNEIVQRNLEKSKQLLRKASRKK